MKRFGGVVFAAIFGCVLVIGAYAFRDRATADQDIPNDASSLIAKKLLREYQDTKDSDKDGIKDWQELLAGSDAETHAANQDPLTPDVASSTEFEIKTHTDRFVVDFFDTYLTERQSYGHEEVPEEFVTKMVEEGIRSFESLNTYTEYKERDIRIIPNDDEADLREYGNDLARAIDTYNETGQVMEGPLEIVNRALENDTPEELAKLEKYKNTLAKMVDALRAIPAPESVAKEHLALMNVISAIGESISHLEKSFDDPVVALVGIKRYDTDSALLPHALGAIRDGLSRAGITYAPGEPGALLAAFLP